MSSSAAPDFLVSFRSVLRGLSCYVKPFLQVKKTVKASWIFSSTLEALAHCRDPQPQRYQTEI